MANDITITITGWVATPPRYVVGPSGSAVCTMRIASTSRYFNRDTNAWEDLNTEWFTARAFRAAAANVRDSLNQGDPVIVTGRLRTHEWQSEDGSRTDMLLDIQAIGPDVTMGTASFTRTTHPGDDTEAPAEASAQTAA